MTKDTYTINDSIKNLLSREDTQQLEKFNDITNDDLTQKLNKIIYETDNLNFLEKRVINEIYQTEDFDYNLKNTSQNLALTPKRVKLIHKQAIDKINDYIQNDYIQNDYLIKDKK